MNDSDPEQPLLPLGPRPYWVPEREFLAHAVRALRGALNWTQADLARAVKKGSRTVARWESEGPTGIALFKLRDVAAEMKCRDLAATFSQAANSEFPHPQKPSPRELSELNDALEGLGDKGAMTFNAISQPWLEALSYLLETPDDPKCQALFAEILRTYNDLLVERGDQRASAHWNRLRRLFRFLDMPEESKRAHVEPTGDPPREDEK